jgi:hypothetical protein
MSRSSGGTAAGIVVGALGAAAIMVSPITPWPLDVAVLGLALFVSDMAVLLVWFLSNG